MATDADSAGNSDYPASAPIDAEVSPETAAGTSHGAGDAETEFVPAPTEAAPTHAWSNEDPVTEVLRRPWRSAWGWGGVVVAITAMVAAAVVGIGLWGWGPSAPDRPVPPMAVPSPMPMPASALPPSAAPPLPSPSSAAPPIRADDQRFLAMLQRDGYPAITSVADAIAAAADVCRMVKRGDDLGYIESWMVPPHGRDTQEQAEVFVADALTAYCPHAGMEPNG